ncbi:MAG: radical SAM protein [Deltaproteobacteria bacterium]|nr:radical SAM protein [Deltaproteobacteria bacterium]
MLKRVKFDESSMVVAGDGGSEEGGISHHRRILGMLRENPNMIRTFGRELFRHKVGAHLDARWRDGFAAPPVRIKINLTRLCNLRCQMCIQDRRDAEKEKFSWNDPRNQLPLEPWVKLLDETMPFMPLIALTGGEPLMYPHFRGFIRAAKERRFVVELITNGTLLDREAEFLVREGVEFVIVSIDGPEEFHDRIRGQKGAYRAAVAGVQSLLDARRQRNAARPLVSLNCTISKTNLAVVDQMMPIASRLGVDVLNYLHTIFDSPENAARHNRIFSEEWVRSKGLEVVFPSLPDGEYYESEIGPEDVPLLEELAAKVQRHGQSPLMVSFSPNLSARKIRPYYLDLHHPFSETCKCLWTDCRILPDGSIIPCLHVRGGNINDGPFLEVWNCPQIRNFRKLVAKRLFPGCARCCCRVY